MGLWIGILFSAAIMPVFWFSEPILRALGQTEQIARDAQSYLRIAGWSILPAVLVTVLRSHLAALDHARVVLYATLVGVALNAGLNWVLIFGTFGAPELGLKGAAIASLGTHSLIFLLLALYAARQRVLRDYTLFARFWRPDWEAFGQVFRLGWPIALTLLAESGLFMATMLMMGWLSTGDLAAHGIAIQIASITFMVHIGLSQAATVRAGQAWGKRDVPRLRLAGIAALIWSGAMVAVTVVAFLAVPAFLVGLFLDPDDPERLRIIARGTDLLAVAALFQLADAAQVMALGLLRGVQDTRRPMIYAVISYWLVGIPCAYLFGFPLGLGGPGIWLGLVVGLVLAGALMMTRFWRGPARAPVSGADTVA
jgi:MATE family multidrug resistance protein